MILFLAGISLENIKSIFEKTNNSYLESITTITDLNDVVTNLPATFRSYSSPEWNAIFNLCCAHCGGKIVKRPKFISNNIDSDGTMYPYGAFCRYVCLASYIDENKYIDERIMLNVYYLYKVEHGRYPKHIPRVKNRLELCIYGGTKSPKEYYSMIERLEAEIS
jgi:hypothetical protein